MILMGVVWAIVDDVGVSYTSYIASVDRSIVGVAVVDTHIDVFIVKAVHGWRGKWFVYTADQ